MSDDRATELLIAAERAMASLQAASPAARELPHETKPIQWEELDGSPAATQADDQAFAGDESIQLRLELGLARLCRHEAQNLRTGSIVPLNHMPSDPVDIYAGDRLIARGEALAVDGRLGVRVVEIAGS